MTRTLPSLDEAVRLHQSGQASQAETIYRRLIKEFPRHADVLYLLGTAEYQRSELALAQEHLIQALEIQPRHAEAHNNLGLVFEDLDQLSKARVHFETAISLNPQYADAHYNLGNVLGKIGQWDRAVEAYRQAVLLRPTFREAHDNLALALRRLERLDEALASSRRAVELDPRSSTAWNNLGAVQKSRGEYLAAAESFRAAVALEPVSAPAWSNLGICLAHLNQFEAAESTCQRAIQIDLRSAIAFNNLGLAYFLQGKHQEAHAAFHRACRIDAQFADAHNNRGSALYRLDRVDEAIEAYRRSVAIQESPIALKNLGSALEHRCLWDESKSAFRRAATLRRDDPLLSLRAELVCPTVFDDAGQIDEYRRGLHRALDRAIERSISRPVEELVDFDLRPSFAWQFHGFSDRDVREKLARVFNPSFSAERPAIRRHGPPRAGFFVAGGHEYSFHRSIGGLFRHFSSNWQPVILCPSASVDSIRRGIRSDDVEIQSVPTSIQTLATAIQALDFDLLYHWEIATSAVNYFLPRLRPTPLQCTSWGIQSTSGLAEIDFYLSSDLFEADDAQRHYSEQLVRLSTLLSCQRPMELPSSPLSRSDLGVPEDRRLYLCAQQIGKFHPNFDAILSAILADDPKGQIVITASGHPAENERLRARLARTLGSLDAISFVPKRVGSAYGSLLMAADVVLDPMPFGGVNTTYDAFSAGRVVVTCPTELFKGRFTHGCYRRMGLDDLVAKNPDDYVRQAVRTTVDRDYRRTCEQRIREAREVLFENTDAANELESWMIETIERHRKQ